MIKKKLKDNNKLIEMSIGRNNLSLELVISCNIKTNHLCNKLENYKFGPFLIRKLINLVEYLLHLLK